MRKLQKLQNEIDGLRAELIKCRDKNIEYIKNISYILCFDPESLCSTTLKDRILAENVGDGLCNSYFYRRSTNATLFEVLKRPGAYSLKVIENAAKTIEEALDKDQVVREYANEVKEQIIVEQNNQ